MPTIPRAISPSKAETGCARSSAPAHEAAKIPGTRQARWARATRSRSARTEVQVIDTPGHTAGHITYVFPADKVAFAGDTLFAIGCGRVIEGNAADDVALAAEVARAAEDTTVYCGHEYTEVQRPFRADHRARQRGLRAGRGGDQLARHGQPTLPTTIALELATNPFLRARTWPPSRSGSAWRASRSGRSSARSGSARTGAEEDEWTLMMLRKCSGWHTKPVSS